MGVYQEWTDWSCCFDVAANPDGLHAVAGNLFAKTATFGHIAYNRYLPASQRPRARKTFGIA